MKIAVTVTVDLADPKEWTAAFGIEGAADIRQDVKDYIGQHLHDFGVFGNGEVSATIKYR
ncbi:hypothetical protein EV193_104354 [Herbihabitans rhizosphaerae]|uniref:Uncharacterized protein n=1 Tax=Herbihabitans rhizosphaerae TaxID=1872711 RepID=A0A4Q7KQM2_9PSEU|nr:hypothetical protein [Herbihabitans rhizosphaerae]RZS39138.1 hypothetical protein EV193_104354 [Herbihabitans rhizosphaerae]